MPITPQALQDLWNELGCQRPLASVHRKSCGKFDMCPRIRPDLRLNTRPGKRLIWREESSKKQSEARTRRPPSELTHGAVKNRAQTRRASQVNAAVPARTSEFIEATILAALQIGTCLLGPTGENSGEFKRYILKSGPSIKQIYNRDDAHDEQND